MQSSFLTPNTVSPGRQQRQQQRNDSDNSSSDCDNDEKVRNYKIWLVEINTTITQAVVHYMVYRYTYMSPHGRYLRFGVREHGTAAICNGLAAHGSVLPYCATFLNFIGYALGAMRVTSLSHFRVIYVMTHDSIGLGEDGPTHQPIEALCSLRAMPNHLVIRPGDGNETSGAYAIALANPTRPCTIH